MCVKRYQNIFYWVKKMNFFGLFLDIEEIRDKDNETGLKERGGIEIETTVLPLRDDDNATGLKERGVIEMSTTVLSITRCIALFRCLYLTYPIQ